MEFAIIAAGEGARLKEEGVKLPKPMVPLCGTPMIERLIRIFANQGATRVHILVNSTSQELADFLRTTEFGIPVCITIEDTSSSLHSLYALTRLNPEWESCVVTTTDTVFNESDFETYLECFRESGRYDAYMGVTAFVDDESPLFVKVNDAMEISGFYDENAERLSYVSAGIYGLRRQAMDCVTKSVAQGHSRMRNYQRSLIDNELMVKAHLFGKVVDVDHVDDIATAEHFLTLHNDK
ncbi:nucleotidyltransferase family protein [Sphingobacterium tabacisoli]|uniref:NDP-sugar synthase n=1 Tax=Sphingobacterium tabacisoli TaxID=2044855 RepID=A0ABW5L7F5_9SPHI|nr:NTP transferase domain-containing protein [Sphingobacterium tabacisoli]